MDALHGVTIVVWLTGGLDIPEGRVRMFWEKIVDTGVRGVVHEGGGEAIARDASERWQIPLEVSRPASRSRRRQIAYSR